MSEEKPQDVIYFLAQIGHEIRTPLNGIKGFGDLLMDETVGPLNERQKFYLSKMLSSSDKLLDIVNQILDWAKLESGQMMIHQEIVNLHHVAREVEGLVELRIQEKGLQLMVEQADDLCIEGDYVRIREIVMNLVNNAIKFTDPGDQITIGFAHTADQHIVMKIADTGTGIADSYRDKLFQPFAKGVDRPGENKSVGLGLWICRSLMLLHQGTITVESEEGKGTTFYLTFPQAQ